MRHTMLSPKSDIVFRAVFRRAEVLGPFLAAVLGTDQPVIHVTEPRRRERKRSKEIIFDIFAILGDGTRVAVEMQVRNQPAFRKRTVFYLGRICGGQLKRGDNYDKLRRSVCVVVTDFVIFEDRAEAHSCMQMRDRGGELFSDIMEIHIVELPKGGSAAHPALGAWIDLLNCTTRRELMDIARRHPETKAAATAILEMEEDELLRWESDMAEKARRDAVDREEGARREGDWNRARINALAMLADGMDPVLVSRYSGLPLEDVLRLRKELQ